MREIGELLKESSANKISTKNTWASTLIDDFEHVEKFQEDFTESTNFQHASIVLDGCVKVYSTRVDSVVDEADKLMESVGRVKETEKPQPKERAHSTISAPEALVLKKKTVSLDDEMLEQLARESKEGDTRGLLMHLLKWEDHGGFQTSQHAMKAEADTERRSTQEHRRIEAESTESLSNLARSLQAGEERKHISPMFARFTPEGSLEDLAFPTYAYYLSYEEQPEFKAVAEEMDAFPFQGDIESRDESECNEPIKLCYNEEASMQEGQDGSAQGQPRLSLTPFGYIQGWAGPAHWKVRAKGKRSAKEKTRERKKAVIDFVGAPPVLVDLLFEKDSRCVFTPQQISERRKDAHMLPQDHSIGTEQLYQMLVCPGSFYRSTRALSQDGSKEKEQEQETEAYYNMQMQAEADELPEVGEEMPYMGEAGEAYGEEVHGQAGYAAHTKEPTLLSRRLLQSALRRGRKNDIVQVKQSLWSQIEQGEKHVQEIYSKVQEEKVSMQFYFVSLLHLANEKNFHISSQSASELPALSELVIE
ncbi:condensin complex subunit 2 [Nematocida sp. AWRm77]|nr:condensin complex subunit 2 [Nematocida sp. AWRm77]